MGGPAPAGGQRSPRVGAIRWLIAVALVIPGGARAQDLSGTYVYETPQGRIGLVLRHERASVTGTMTGVDGQVSRLEGRFDGRRAIGSISASGQTGWFAAGLVQRGLTLLVAEVDPATGEPDLENGWRLDFTAVAGDPSPGPVASGPAARPGSPTAATPLVQQWIGRLRGKKLTYTESYTSNDMAGGYSSRWEAFLCSDMSFHFRSSSVGLGGAGEAFSGTWRVVEHGGQAVLQYQRSELAGTDQGVAVVLSERNGQTFFDGSRVYVTADNDVCP